MFSDATPQIYDKHRAFSPAFKLNIAQLALAGELSVSVIARQYDIKANQFFAGPASFDSNRCSG